MASRNTFEAEFGQLSAFLTNHRAKLFDQNLSWHRKLVLKVGYIVGCWVLLIFLRQNLIVNFQDT